MKAGICARILLLALMAFSLGACEGEGTQFNSVDITGADYGRDFALTDPAGNIRQLADFRGKVVLVFFGFLQCPDVCPTSLLRAAEVKRLLGRDGERLQVIFITLDPERDLPPIIREYTAAFAPDFLGLYANPEKTQETANAFRVYYRKVATGSSYTVEHSALSYLYDPEGRLRLAVKHETTAEALAADVRALLHPVISH
ncbi:SCO1/SenC family protein [Betaproteobacteria bacterium]|nr:SCO1/SenC family protein [Betaproteobacteria bacterium]GHT92137.1 SCO1/SenC family protein [Betaproteobacteria bacterium]GHT98382.1 SCO1/SenC family protein [Betaproteobacteria bacterium]GHU07075.1 SCO1/SenC family protein [Betaproteobacteria bacterium]GHU16766.1 SCO1/SenC family protein [Betaproteobacteria bacterium]